MDLLRLIKIKQLNGDFDHLGEKEKLFFSFFNDLYSVKEHNSIYFFNDDEYYFECNLTTNLFWCSKSKIWLVFKLKYELNYYEIQELIRDILEKRLNLVGVTPVTQNLQLVTGLNKHLDLVRTTHN